MNHKELAMKVLTAVNDSAEKYGVMYKLNEYTNQFGNKVYEIFKVSYDIGAHNERIANSRIIHVSFSAEGLLESLIDLL